MVRGGKKEVQNAEANPDAEERKERKRKAFSKGILSEAPAKSLTALRPSKTLLKHHGKDVVRKSQRKNRFLFSFPGLLAPISGGKIGELKDLGTKNPILYLDFPQGQMKLFGTIVYPKNRYLTLQFSRGGKSVICEDYFDTMIVFSDAWWIGKREDNPEEARIEFPKELHEAHNTEYDFKGGAGAAAEMKQGFNKCGLEYVEQESPKTDLEDDPSDGQNKFEYLSEVTPSRHSERTAGKRFNFAEVSSGEDFVGDDVNASEEEEKKDIMEHLTRGYAPGKTEISHPLIFDINNEDGAGSTPSGQIQQSAISVTKSKELSHGTHSSFVQTTISTMFKKVEEKKAPRNLRNPPSSKDSSENLQHVGSAKITNKVKDKGPRKKQKVIDRKAGLENVADKQLEKSNSVEPAKVYKRKTKDFTPSTPAAGKKSQVPASNSAVAVTSSQGGEMETFPWRKLWKTTAPTKICFFSWCAARGRILTLDNLKLRGYSIANRCSLCLNHEESIDHLLLHCTWSADLWNLSLSCFGIQMCFPDDLKNFLVVWWGQPLGKRRKKIWNLVPFCLFWLIWKERKRRTFESIERSILRVKSLFIFCLYSW